jgi:hypothetical protein
MIINFNISKINQDICKLIQTLLLIKKKNTRESNLSSTSICLSVEFEQKVQSLPFLKKKK